MEALSQKDRALFVDWGRRGGKKRARRLSVFKRSEIASQAAKSRWQKRPVLSKPFASVRLITTEPHNPTYLEEILNEGNLDHWRELYQTLLNHPFGEIAKALETVLSSTKMYGITALWGGILRRIQGTSR